MEEAPPPHYDSDQNPAVDSDSDDDMGGDPAGDSEPDTDGDEHILESDDEFEEDEDDADLGDGEVINPAPLAWRPLPVPMYGTRVTAKKSDPCYY